MDSKIRILSYQNAQNFGAVLQAYGLQQTLKGLGYTDVSFINYNPSYLRNRYLVFPKKWLCPPEKGFQNAIRYYINLPFKIFNRYLRNQRFNKSRKALISQTGKQIQNINGINGICCNYLILGSDQIWSTWITGTPDPVFYGKGDYKGLKRIISYAPSTELSSFDNKYNSNIIQEYIGGIDCLSVREISVKEKIYELTGRNAFVCADPTILCGKEYFDQIIKRRVVKAEYILVYAYDNGAQLIQDIIRTIPQYEQYEVHYIAFGCSGARETFSKTSHNEILIEDFLSLFKYASYVVTNSFHGLVFSLLFNNRFAVAFEPGKSARCESLLQQIDASDKMVHRTNDVNWNSFDFDHINEKMEAIREYSKQFIINSLS